jgi:hypothetical protein
MVNMQALYGMPLRQNMLQHIGKGPLTVAEMAAILTHHAPLSEYTMSTLKLRIRHNARQMHHAGMLNVRYEIRDDRAMVMVMELTPTQTENPTK